MFFLAFLPFFPGPLELPSTTGFFSAFGGLPGFFKPLLFPPFCSPSTPFAGAMFRPVTPRCNNNKKERERCKSPLKTLTRNTPTPPKQQTTKGKKVGRRALHQKYSFLPLLSLFPVYTWTFSSSSCSPFTLEFYSRLIIPRSHANFPVRVQFPVHTSILLSSSSFTPVFTILFLFPVHTSILPYFTSCYLLTLHMSIFQSFSSSPGHMWNFQSFPIHEGNFCILPIFGPHVHQENFIIYHPFFCS